MAKGSGTTRSTVNASISPIVKTFINEARSGHISRETRSAVKGVDDMFQGNVTYDSTYDKRYDKYTDEQKKALHRYTSGSNELNKALEEGILSQKQKETVAEIDKMFRPLSKSVIVYKGWEAGDLRNTKSYASTSTSVMTANNFMFPKGGLAAFVLPKGTPVIYAGKLETEILLPRNFNLKKYRLY